MNLPPEVLESLAYSNYYSPRPQPIDPAVFFDLVKIRRLIDDATSLAVRAANGTTSAALTNSLNASNGYLNGADAEILGIGSARGGGGNAKLSRERKYRMREHATQKLAHAYRLDEIAASVATMQSASALEEVAKHVLQRNETDSDAQYVHFFHEKIPSRALAECTSLNPLSNIIQQRPTEAAPYRTRAVTRIFKDDHLGATRDLTDGLAIHRLYRSDHGNEQRELILAKDAVKLQRSEAKVDEKDQPSSLEPQLLFHRAGSYLTLACQHIADALRGHMSSGNARNGTTSSDDLPIEESPAQKEEARARMEARKLVRTYAKRALRDYTVFLSHFDYTPGLSADFTDAFLEKVKSMYDTKGRRSRSERLLDIESHTQNGLSEALVRYEGQKHRRHDDHFPQIPKPAVHRIGDLFNPVPPVGLPPYPIDLETMKIREHAIFSLPDFSEAVTYHPLLTDVLHSLLLCHCLVQTSVKEHQRHAYMAARVARVCDGYPIFLAARSPARADWIEVLRRTKNWLGLEQSWEALCTPAPLPGQRGGVTKTSQDNVQKEKTDSESKEQKLERIKREAVREALADERVVDEDTFRASVRAREARAIAEEDEEMRKDYNRITPTRSSSSSAAATLNDNAENSNLNGQKGFNTKRWAQEDGKEYPITTDRAEAIARWIREAPPPSASSDGKAKKSGNSSKRGKLRKMASDMSGGMSGLEKSVDSLDMVD